MKSGTRIAPLVRLKRFGQQIQERLARSEVALLVPPMGLVMDGRLCTIKSLDYIYTP